MREVKRGGGKRGRGEREEEGGGRGREEERGGEEEEERGPHLNGGIRLLGHGSEKNAKMKGSKPQIKKKSRKFSFFLSAVLTRSSVSGDV